jgi:hypothetical protein
MSRHKRLLAAGPKTLVLALAAGIFAIALFGCGSSEEHDRMAGGRPNGPGAVTNSSPKDSASLSRKQDASGKPGGRRSNSNRPDRSRAAGRSGSGETDSARVDHGRRMRQSKGGSVCPGGMSKPECKARIEGEIGSKSQVGRVVSTPSQCVKVMSKAQCKEILTAQKAAQEEAGRSVSPETCLQEYSREFCETRFKEQYEQQAAAQVGQ